MQQRLFLQFLQVYYVYLFAPLSFEKHKALIEVKGEILIERQIRQLQEAGIKEIIVVTGYMAEQFEYLKKKYGVVLVHNPDYLIRNNNASIYVVREYATSFDSIAYTAACYSYKKLEENEHPHKSMELTKQL